MKKSGSSGISEFNIAIPAMQLGAYQAAVDMRLTVMEEQQFPLRFWLKDYTLWQQPADAQKSIIHSMGWLGVVEKMIKALPVMEQFAEEVRRMNFKHVVLMGMGGSSLAPLVLQRSFPLGENGIPVTVLDTTDPSTLLSIEKSIRLEETLFIVASKSGTTTEPTAFYEYFYDKVKQIRADRAGEHFVAITDPGTALVDVAHKQKFRHTFLNFSDIGGRYSALSYFGLVPAVLMGLNVKELLQQALKMVQACGPNTPIRQNPGIFLGTVIGELAKQGRDKLTFVIGEPFNSLGLWLEQLVAESTGKQGTGIFPLEEKQLDDGDVYGNDRFFIFINLVNDYDASRHKKIKALTDAGHPVMNIYLQNSIDIGQEFFKWEVATATAGAVLGINPFDQPNVQQTKTQTEQLLKQVSEKKNWEDTPLFVEDGLSIYASCITEAGDVKTLLDKFIAEGLPGNYFAILAYLQENDRFNGLLWDFKEYLQRTTRLATSVGYGPRYLHSTGQYHKGAANNGLFIQFTTTDVQDVLLPGRSYSFGTLKNAQAQGDYEALRKYKRRILRINLGSDPVQGLLLLKQKLSKAEAVHAA